MAEFNSYLLGKARKSVGNLTIVYAKGKNIVRAKVFGRKDNPTPEVLMQRMRVRLLGRFARRILPVIRKGFAGVGKGTAYNAFMRIVGNGTATGASGGIEKQGYRRGNGSPFT